MEGIVHLDKDLQSSANRRLQSTELFLSKEIYVLLHVERSGFTQVTWVLLVGMIAGCGGDNDKTYPVTGVVVWADGQPASELRGANIELQLIDATARKVSPHGEVQADGTFTLGSYRQDDGAAEGDYRALVMPQKSQDAEGPHTVYIMDPQFENYDTSELKVTIEPKANEITLRVQKPK